MTRTFLFHSVFIVYLGYKSIASFLLSECSSSRFCLFSRLGGNRAAFHYNCHSSYITSIGNVQECLCRGEWTVQFVWCIGVKVVWMACFIAFKWIKYLNVSCVFIATNRSYFSMNCWKFLMWTDWCFIYIKINIWHKLTKFKHKSSNSINVWCFLFFITAESELKAMDWW